MLALGRRIGEEILIEPGGIRIVISDIKVPHKKGGKGKVIVGIEANKDFTILRKEVVDRQREEFAQCKAE